MWTYTAIDDFWYDKINWNWCELTTGHCHHKIATLYTSAIINQKYYLLLSIMPCLIIQNNQIVNKNFTKLWIRFDYISLQVHEMISLKSKILFFGRVIPATWWLYLFFFEKISQNLNQIVVHFSSIISHVNRIAYDSLWRPKNTQLVSSDS